MGGMDGSAYVTATYLVHDKGGDWHKKAMGMARGLTVGSWTDLPQAKQEAMRKHLGEVVSIEELGRDGHGMKRAKLTIAYPMINFTADLPALLTTVFGKVSMDGAIRLIDLALPDAFIRQFPGPQFGVQGVRQLLGVEGRPLLMSIFKACIGYDLDTLTEQFALQAAGGVDLVKDDEIFFQDAAAPFEKRIESCLRAAERAEKETGKKVLYAVNLTGPVTEIFDKARRAVNAGANALLLNVLPFGYDVLHRLAADPEIGVPLVAHPALSGALYASDRYGIAASLVLGQWMRLAGADLVLYPSPYGTVALKREESLSLVHQLRREQGGLAVPFPVPSAGIHPGLVPLLYRDLGVDHVVNAGGGIHGHPQGTAAGGRAFVAAIDATCRGVPLRAAAETSPELRAALDLWGYAEEEKRN